MNDWKDWPIKEKALKGIDKKPIKVFYRGEWQKDLLRKTLAIVGSRRISRYGREVIDLIMPNLVAAGVTVVSGFMYGIDSYAHHKCLDLGGRTIAILGNGLNYLYPKENDGLYSQILEKDGLVISEYQPDDKAALWTFVQRNRIVAGLANLGVVVVEAGLDSGSLITVRFARKQGKKVWAVPGLVNQPGSMGCNFLIKEGMAEILTGADDILNIKRKDKGAAQLDFFNQLDPGERKILNELKYQDYDADELARILKLDSRQINQSLAMLMLKNLIKEEAGKIYLNKDGQR